MHVVSVNLKENIRVVNLRRVNNGCYKPFEEVEMPRIRSVSSLTLSGTTLVLWCFSPIVVLLKFSPTTTFFNLHD